MSRALVSFSAYALQTILSAFFSNFPFIFFFLFCVISSFHHKSVLSNVNTLHTLMNTCEPVRYSSELIRASRPLVHTDSLDHSVTQSTCTGCSIWAVKNYLGCCRYWPTQACSQGGFWGFWRTPPVKKSSLFSSIKGPTLFSKKVSERSTLK